MTVDKRRIVLFGSSVWERVSATSTTREYLENAEGRSRVRIYPPSKDVTTWQVEEFDHKPGHFREYHGERAEATSFLVAASLTTKTRTESAAATEVLG